MQSPTGQQPLGGKPASASAFDDPDAAEDAEGRESLPVAWSAACRRNIGCALSAHHGVPLAFVVHAGPRRWKEAPRPQLRSFPNVVRAGHSVGLDVSHPRFRGGPSWDRRPLTACTHDSPDCTSEWRSRSRTVVGYAFAGLQTPGPRGRTASVLARILASRLSARKPILRCADALLPRRSWPLRVGSHRVRRCFT